jgi:glutathione synthase/RimK-type ligase-like ATP-grasp enzyme
MDDLQGFVSDDNLAYAPLRALGWEVEAVPWRRPLAAWEQYDVVVIRSTWDYHLVPEEFLAVLRQIQQAGARLENSFDLVQWNIRKTYLRDLAQRGVLSVPTVWGTELGPVDERTILECLGTDQVILKPVIGANAANAYRLSRGSTAWSEAVQTFAERDYLAQPFLGDVLREGEYSLIYFNGRLSHCILKTPLAHDFRVQEEHGGTIRAVAASSALVQAGERVLAAVRQVPLYARVDLVRMERSFGLMELELIEPSLYLRMDVNAPERFARALDSRMAGEWASSQ